MMRDKINDKKILIGFYNESVEPYIEELERFENEFEVHVFDNFNYEEYEEFNIEAILNELFSDDYNLSNINIISNDETFIIDLFKKYSYKFNGFIYDNSFNKNSHNKHTGIDVNNYIYNFNLFCINEYKSSYDYIKLKNMDLYSLYDEMIDNYFNTIVQMIRDFYNAPKYFSNLELKSQKAKNYICNLDREKKNDIRLIFENRLKEENEFVKIYVYSFLLYLFKEKSYSDKICDIALSSNNLTKENRFFIMYELIEKAFPDIELSRIIDKDKLDRIYDKVFLEYKEKMENLKFIPKVERNKEWVFVFISQFLSTSHGPTKTVLDRCYSLIKDMKKKVLLINTKEFGGMSGITLMNDLVVPNVIDDYEKINYIIYKNIDIPYYQPSGYMPNDMDCISILNIVKKYKPYLIFNIGGYSITADLCAQIVPMATISTSGNYSISKNKGQFFIMGRKATESDYKYIAKDGHTKEAIIECPFTFDLKKQKNNYSRKDFGIPEDKFVITTIGGRLKREIDEEYLKMIDYLTQKGCFFVTVGDYDLPENIKKKYVSLNKNFKSLGFQEDVLACIDLVDIYLNPKRQGGGTSAVECMFKGKPALSLQYGDVSMLVNKENLVDDNKEMEALTLKLKDDRNYYNEMSEKAREKAAYLMNTRKYFSKAYRDIINSSIFK